jgi:hypothetical protein
MFDPVMAAWLGRGVLGVPQLRQLESWSPECPCVPLCGPHAWQLHSKREGQKTKVKGLFRQVWKAAILDLGFLVVLGVLGFELRVHTSSHSTSPLC